MENIGIRFKKRKDGAEKVKMLPDLDPFQQLNQSGVQAQTVLVVASSF